MGRNKKTPHKRHKSGFRGPSPDVGKATQFKPGVSGNPGGRPSKRLLDEMYEELLLADNAEAAKAIALAMLKRARKGDVKSAQLINERTQVSDGLIDRVISADQGLVTRQGHFGQVYAECPKLSIFVL